MVRIFSIATVLSLVVLSASCQADAPEGITPEIQAYIDEQVALQVQQALEENRLVGDAFQAKASEAINQFIADQQRAQQEAQERQASERAKTVTPVSVETDFIRGDIEAEFSLIEYSDFECPFCKRFHDSAIAFTQANADLNWVHRHFPLDFHNPGAQKQSEGAECAGELGGTEAFWAFTDAVYSRTSAGGTGFPLSNVIPLAVELGLDEASFTECYESGSMAQRVQNDMRDGQLAGVAGTPGNILRHNPTGEVIAINGAQPVEGLQDALNRLKARIAEQTN